MKDVGPISNFEGNAGTFKGGRNLGSKPASKGGRPAQPGERYPSGKLKPDDDAPAAKMKRLFDAGLRGAADPLFGTSLGMLFMRKLITAQEFAAGTAYAKLRGRYDRAMSLPRRSAVSPDYGIARSGGGAVPMTDTEVAGVKRRQADMFKAIDGALEDVWCVSDGQGGMRWVSPEGERAKRRTEAERTVALIERVCLNDLSCESFEIERLRGALRLLASFFGIAHG